MCYSSSEELSDLARLLLGILQLERRRSQTSRSAAKALDMHLFASSIAKFIYFECISFNSYSVLGELSGKTRGLVASLGKGVFETAGSDLNRLSNL